MKRIDELMGTAVRGGEMPTSHQSKQWQGSFEQREDPNRRSIKFWQEMMGLYSDRWQAKNGRAPSSRWNQAITALTDQQLQGVVDQCITRCCEGNTFAPDLAEFMAMASESAGNPFGLEVADVMSEFSRYNRNRLCYSCAETFPWRQPVLFWIVCDLRREMYQRNLSEMEVEKRADVHLKAWAEKIRQGETVPEPKPLLSEKPVAAARNTSGDGHAAAMRMLDRIKSRNASGVPK